MKAYVISIVICSILIALTELILPQKRLKSVVNTVFSISLLVIMIKPLSNDEDQNYIPTFNQNSQQTKPDSNYFNNYFDERFEKYYEALYQRQLLNSDLVTDKIIVEIENMQILCVQIFLSNLVIPEENTHINNNVIVNYVAEILGLEKEKVQIYV